MSWAHHRLLVRHDVDRSDLASSIPGLQSLCERDSRATGCPSGCQHCRRKHQEYYPLSPAPPTLTTKLSALQVGMRVSWLPLPCERIRATAKPPWQALQKTWTRWSQGPTPLSMSTLSGRHHPTRRLRFGMPYQPAAQTWMSRGTMSPKCCS